MKIVLKIVLIAGLTSSCFAHEESNCFAKQPAIRLTDVSVSSCANREYTLATENSSEIQAKIVNNDATAGVDLNQQVWFVEQKEYAMKIAGLLSAGVIYGAAVNGAVRVICHLMTMPLPQQRLTLIQKLLMSNAGSFAGLALGLAASSLDSLLEANGYSKLSRGRLEALVKVNWGMCAFRNSALTSSYILESFGF